jgi:hypothetical protein
MRRFMMGFATKKWLCINAFYHNGVSQGAQGGALGATLKFAKFQRSPDCHIQGGNLSGLPPSLLVLPASAYIATLKRLLIRY